ncbi:cardiolipin synthase [PVC group bacterium]|nr:cardiolipin synthase [PVC group bacterium]
MATLTLPSITWSWLWIASGWGLHILCFVLVTLHSLRSRREPSSSLVWIFLAWSIPFVGPLLYVSIGVDRVPDKGFKKHINDQLFLEEREAKEEEALPLAYWHAVHRKSVHGKAESELGRELNKAMDTILPEYPMLTGNDIQPLVTGDEAYPKMLEAIESAESHIHLQSFIIQNDKTGRRFMRALARKAIKGVKVRVLFDRFGSTQAFLTGLIWHYRKVPNMTVVGWTQANPLKRQFQLNLRNHRKTLIIDGKLAFTGGINLHRENITRRKKQPIRDYHFELQGPVVQELQYSFLRDWYFMTDENADELLKEENFPTIASAGKISARLLNSGPTSEKESITDIVFMAITQAHKQILMVTPYFVPPPDIIRALRSAALRGIDVRLITPAKNNHIYAGLAERSFYEDLLESGVRIFNRAPPFMHAKAMLIDNHCAIVGTANLDVRSLRLNYETNIVVYNEAFSDKMKRIVLDDEAQSEEVILAQWRIRPAWKRMAENLAFLLSPVL